MEQKWSSEGVSCLQAEGIIEVRVKFICLDSTTVKVHPDACGAWQTGNWEKSRRTHYKNSYGYRV